MGNKYTHLSWTWNSVESLKSTGVVVSLESLVVDVAFNEFNNNFVLNYLFMNT